MVKKEFDFDLCNVRNGDNQNDTEMSGACVIMEMHVHSLKRISTQFHFDKIQQMT